MYRSTESMMRMLENMTEEQLTAFVGQMLVSMAIMVVFSLIVCFVVAKGTGLSLGYTFLGLLGMTGVMIVVCRVIIKKNDANPLLMWIGFFGVVGVFIVIMLTSYNNIQKTMNGNSGGGSFWTNGTNQNRENEVYRTKVQEDEYSNESQGYTLNGEYYERDRGTICLSCGSAVEAGEKNCPHCGNRVR